MRTIKFRGKKKANDQWVYGYLMCDFQGTFRIMGKSFAYVAVVTDTIGQYIGLHDMNEVEIYEGDILLSKYAHPYSVYWDSRKMCFALGNAVNEQLGVQFVKDYGLRVIGNVHDNPTLIADICSNKIAPNF
jgi:hypothetical protein